MFSPGAMMSGIVCRDRGSDGPRLLKPVMVPGRRRRVVDRAGGQHLRHSRRASAACRSSVPRCRPRPRPRCRPPAGRRSRRRRLGLSAAPVAPGVVDRIGGQGRVGVLAVQVPGRQVPLEALGEAGVVAAAVVHVLAVDGLGAGGHADLVAAAVVADHGAGGVGAVAVAVAGIGRVGAGGIPPVVVVVPGRAGGGFRQPR